MKYPRNTVVFRCENPQATSLEEVARSLVRSIFGVDGPCGDNDEIEWTDKDFAMQIRTVRRRLDGPDFALIDGFSLETEMRLFVFSDGGGKLYKIYVGALEESNYYFVFVEAYDKAALCPFIFPQFPTTLAMDTVNSAILDCIRGDR